MKLEDVLKSCAADDVSLPAWGAWIEIYEDEHGTKRHAVAPRMGGVD